LLLGVGDADADRDDLDMVPRSLMRSASSSADFMNGFTLIFTAI